MMMSSGAQADVNQKGWLIETGAWNGYVIPV